MSALSKYKTYPEYKDSGVEWLGEIPKHWDAFSLKRTIDKCTNGIWGNEPNEKNDLIVLRVADFDRDKLIISDDKLTYRSISNDEKANRLLTKGDLLIEKSGGGDKTLVGCVVLFNKEYEAVTSNFVAKMTPLKGFSSAFLNYSFNKLYSEKINFLSIKQTTGIQNLDSNAYLTEYFCFPSLKEQTKIAQFLDHETAKIDQLIEKQQTLIALLKEKRQAVISHAVTKGLDPNVKMKDSGVEWLGEVPEHWDISPIKRITQSMEQGKSPECENIPADPYQWGVLKTSCVNYGLFDASQNKTLPNFIKPHTQYQVKSGDVLMSRANGSVNLIGSVALVQNDVQKNLLLSDKIFRIKLNKKIDAKFFTILMSTPYIRTLIERAISGAEGMANNITKTAIFEFPAVVPSLDEQIILVNYLNKKLQSFDSLIKKTEQQIELIKERRTALISAAVTGKIDVRNWQPEQP